MCVHTQKKCNTNWEFVGIWCEFSKDNIHGPINQPCRPLNIESAFCCLKCTPYRLPYVEPHMSRRWGAHSPPIRPYEKHKHPLSNCVTIFHEISCMVELIWSQLRLKRILEGERPLNDVDYNNCTLKYVFHYRRCWIKPCLPFVVVTCL